MKSTKAVLNPIWEKDGFVEKAAREMWHFLPELFQKIAKDEFKLGNNASSIFYNGDRDIYLLAFEFGPLSKIPKNKNIKTHTQHDGPNYCYDDVKETYEDKKTGCFLIFDDPNYEDDGYFEQFE